jgi:hypothetical protein
VGVVLSFDALVSVEPAFGVQATAVRSVAIRRSIASRDLVLFIDFFLSDFGKITRKISL